MDKNIIQKLVSLLLKKEPVKTLSDLQLLFDRYDTNISNRYDAVKDGKPMLYLREDLTQWAKEAFERGEKYFYCKPVNEKIPCGELILYEPTPNYNYKLLRPLTEEYNNIFSEFKDE